jgi:hypothetical protein
MAGFILNQDIINRKIFAGTHSCFKAFYKMNFSFILDFVFLLFQKKLFN